MMRLATAAAVVLVAVLSLAVPVAVDAQTPTVTVTENTQMVTRISLSGFTAGTYYLGGCSGTTAPASCTYDSMGEATSLAGYGSCDSVMLGPSGTNVNTIHGLLSNRQRTEPYRRFAVYSDSACTTEVTSVSYTKPTTLPSWRARDITDDSATIYIEEAYSTHGIFRWDYTLAPGNVGCTRVHLPGRPGLPTASPVSSLTGLSAGTTYTYSVHASGICDDSAIATVTFTTHGGSGPPGPAPPTGVEATAVEATTDGSGSVTLSWSNPGDPDIATYEYYLQRAGGPAGEWRTVAGSNADTTSVTIDLTTGEAVAGNARGVTPPMVEWTIYLRARGVNGAASRATSTVVSTAAGTVVPALPLAGLATLALLLFLGGMRRRNGSG